MPLEVDESLSESMGFSPTGTNGENLKLAMQRLVLTGRLLPVGARLVVRHSFVSAEANPVESVYSFALPRDAALRRFRVSGPGFDVHSELKPVEEATKIYEEGLDQGHLGTLARAYRDGVVNLSVGNLRQGEPVTVLLEILAGVELRDDGWRFRFPFALAPSYHPGARAVLVEPDKGEVELPPDEFGDVLLPPIQASAEGLHQVAFELNVDAQAEITEIASPSHAIRVRKPNDSEGRVALAPEGDVPDRDLVVDVTTESDSVRTLSGAGADGRSHFAVLVPSTRFGEPGKQPRSVAFVLDRSGSMQGSPILQARKAVAACVATLEKEDRFGLVAFDNRIEMFRRGLVRADRKGRDEAKKFLDRIDARGGTELASGVRAAAQMLAGGGGDIFLVTDGQVFGTEDILNQTRATGVRIHCLGIGSASQDRFLALLARETGGVDHFVTPRERVDEAALDLFASVKQPRATNLRATLQELEDALLEPQPPSAVYSGSPLLLTGECASDSRGAISVEWEAAPDAMRFPLHVTSDSIGETLRLLRGARLITDLESRYSGYSVGRGVERRKQERLKRKLEKLSDKFGLASRVMALVAVVERPADQAGLPPKTSVVPVALPQDMEMLGAFGFTGGRSMLHARQVMGIAPGARVQGPGARGGGSLADFVVDTSAMFEAPSDEDRLVDLAYRLEPDGGMPGDNDEDRILATVLALLALGASGNYPDSGPFRLHSERMVEFLRKKLPADLSEEQLQAANRALEAIVNHQSVDSEWIDRAVDACVNGRLRARRNWSRLSKIFVVTG